MCSLFGARSCFLKFVAMIELMILNRVKHGAVLWATRPCIRIHSHRRLKASRMVRPVGAAKDSCSSSTTFRFLQWCLYCHVPCISSRVGSGPVRWLPVEKGCSDLVAAHLAIVVKLVRSFCLLMLEWAHLPNVVVELTSLILSRVHLPMVLRARELVLEPHCLLLFVHVTLGSAIHKVTLLEVLWLWQVSVCMSHNPN